MLLAQLHRKVPSDFEGMEDVLTSSVLSALKYVPADIAKGLLAQFASIPLPAGSLQVDLWPRFPTPPGLGSPALATGRDGRPAARGHTEPDALITTEGWVILIEAKYRSALDDTYDQLARQFAVGYDLARDTGRRFRLLVVTAHVLEPTPGGVDLLTGVRKTLHAASGALGDVAVDTIVAVPAALRWTNWQQLHSLFSTACAHADVPGATRQLLRDICRLLELRGLKPYDAGPMAGVLVRWVAAGVPDELWSRPMDYRYRTVSSVAAGWEELLRLDMSVLRPLSWRIRVPLSRYDLAAHLARFDLRALRAPEWRPSYHRRRRLL